MKRTVWTITKDINPDPNARPGTNANAIGVVGPYDAPRIVAEDWGGLGPLMLSNRIVGHPDAKRFRMFDDDGNLMYEGSILIGDEEGGDFLPLDDFGTPNVGATEIEYLENGKWTKL